MSTGIKSKFAMSIKLPRIKDEFAGKLTGIRGIVTMSCRPLTKSQSFSKAELRITLTPI